MLSAISTINHTRRFPCTVEKQIASQLLGLDSLHDVAQIIPTFYVDTRSHNAPAPGGAIFTIADSGYDWNYVWYTLELYVYQSSNLIYYDQHTYFVEETLPDDVLPEFDIPQAAMDSLVTLTMQGYVDRLK